VSISEIWFFSIFLPFVWFVLVRLSQQQNDTTD